ncbi:MULTISPECIES: ribonuclease D [Komagataeibacter]|uniref:Ribonuclease D n=2 Tax=Komagataeibacter TaxID=1434011 RepID=A0A0D6Q8H1_KOMXY|nr:MULTISPECIES: ribonuclease D [Komagataeibacter]MBL7234446.1 ribonuclease D [Komagataeibacter oboediens]MBT0674711.1 ribonuclease D [Komagataeibacter oboediens]MBT0677513.1 ribonuclease D [Komagataeibacter oboediens]WEQ52747.1 ribonuclease D [Komagataeibacter oboediens]GAN99096.1 ribonuclease D [Komagataeibacter xylinus NBRC 13693]
MARVSRPEFPAPVLVTTTAELEAVTARLRHEPFVTIDTEFVRERTYWPELCLVQLAGEKDVVVIDTTAPGIDLTSLGALLDDASVVKVFHAARQDLEIFLHLFDHLPAALFDTQVAAMVAGYGDQVGYDNLVSSLLGVQIDKSHRFSDWAARPLSPAQIGYAAADVTYLRLVYEKLLVQLEREGRLDWVAAELDILNNPTTFRPDPLTLWEKMRPRTNNRRMLGILRAVAAWREGEAQRVNVPRQRLLKDESLMEIAATAPATIDALARVRGVSRGFAEGRSGQALLETVAQAVEEPEAALPRLPKGRAKDAQRPSPALIALLKVLLASCCETHRVAPRLVASSEDLDRFALDDAADIPAFHGWRNEVFGKLARELKAGHLTMGVAGGKVRLIHD